MDGISFYSDIALFMREDAGIFVVSTSNPRIYIFNYLFLEKLGMGNVHRHYYFQNHGKEKGMMIVRLIRNSESNDIKDVSRKKFLEKGRDWCLRALPVIDRMNVSKNCYKNFLL